MASAISGRPAAAARRGSPEAVRLLAPFDPIVWERRRFEHLWGWDYRFEAYTRPEQRRFGYYAMPLLWGYDVIGWANVSLKEDGWTPISASSARDRGIRRSGAAWTPNWRRWRVS